MDKEPLSREEKILDGYRQLLKGLELKIDLETFRTVLKKEFSSIFPAKNKRERTSLLEYYGLLDGRRKSLSCIAEVIGVGSPEVVLLYIGRARQRIRFYFERRGGSESAP